MVLINSNKSNRVSSLHPSSVGWIFLQASLRSQSSVDRFDFGKEMSSVNKRIQRAAETVSHKPDGSLLTNSWPTAHVIILTIQNIYIHQYLNIYIYIKIVLYCHRPLFHHHHILIAPISPLMYHHYISSCFLHPLDYLTTNLSLLIVLKLIKWYNNFTTIFLHNYIIIKSHNHC